MKEQIDWNKIKEKVDRDIKLEVENFLIKLSLNKSLKRNQEYRK